MSEYRIFRMEAAPRANPEARLDGAWRIRRTYVLDGLARRHTIVARFAVDGRDACERWAHKRGITLGARVPNQAT